MKLVLAKDSDTNTISFKHLKTGEYVTIKTPKREKSELGHGNSNWHLYATVRSMRLAGYRLSVTMTDSITADKLYQYDKEAVKIVKEITSKKTDPATKSHLLNNSYPELAQNLLASIKK